MCRIVLVSLLGSLVLTPLAVDAYQDHASPAQHQSKVMGFDQSRTAHHFSLFQNGGAIEVVVKDRADTTNRDAIRSHLPHITGMFASGDFDAPMREIRIERYDGSLHSAAGNWDIRRSDGGPR